MEKVEFTGYIGGDEPLKACCDQNPVAVEAMMTKAKGVKRDWDVGSMIGHSPRPNIWPPKKVRVTIEVIDA